MNGSFTSGTHPAVIAALALLFASGGCGRSPSAPAEPVYYTSISRDVVVIPETGLCYLHSRDRDEFTFFSPGDIPDLREGSVIAGTGMGGYIRRVDSFMREGYRLILRTRPASLTDAVRRGRVEASIPAGPGMGGRIDLSGLSFHPDDDPGKGEVRITGGFVEFNPFVDISLSILDRSITGFDVTVSGPAVFSLEVTADLPEAFDWSGRIGLVSLKRRAELRFDAVPLVVDIELTLEVKAEMKGRFYDGCAYGCVASGLVLYGARYAGGEWESVDMTSFDHQCSDMACGSGADGTVVLTVEPSIAVRFDGESNLSIGMPFSVRAYAATQTPPVWWWELSAERPASFFFDPCILGGSIAGFEASLTDTVELRSGPYRTDDFIFLLSWGREGAEAENFLNPSGITTGSDGAIYVSDKTAHAIKKFTPDGAFVSSWGSFGTGLARMSFPAGLACGPDGDIYLADSGNHRIQRFRPDGTFVSSWGSYGTGQGQFVEPQGVAFATDGHVYVCDSYTCTVQKFTGEGEFVLGWGGQGDGEGLFTGPMGITCDKEGHVYVSECYNHRVQKFDADGGYIAGWGLAGLAGGHFDCPAGLAAGDDGRIFAVDYGNDRVQIFTARGTLLSTLGFGGSDDGGFDGPYGIAVSPNGDLFVTDTANHRVQRFAVLLENR